MICGGAALTRKYVEDDLRKEYSNAVFYADDAFAGLHIMEDLATANGKKQARLLEGRTVKEYAKAAVIDAETGPVFAERSAVIQDAPDIPVPGACASAKITTSASIFNKSMTQRYSRISGS